MIFVNKAFNWEKPYLLCDDTDRHIPRDDTEFWMALKITVLLVRSSSDWIGFDSRISILRTDNEKNTAIRFDSDFKHWKSLGRVSSLPVLSTLQNSVLLYTNAFYRCNNKKVFALKTQPILQKHYWMDESEQNCYINGTALQSIAHNKCWVTQHLLSKLTQKNIKRFTWHRLLYGISLSLSLSLSLSPLSPDYKWLFWMSYSEWIQI